MSDTAVPTSVLIFWHEPSRNWLATPIKSADAISVIGTHTMDGNTPALALDALFENMLCHGFNPENASAVKVTIGDGAVA